MLEKSASASDFLDDRLEWRRIFSEMRVAGMQLSNVAFAGGFFHFISLMGFQFQSLNLPGCFSDFITLGDESCVQ